MGRLNWNYARQSSSNRRWITVSAIALVGCLHALWWRDTLLVQRDSVVERAHRLSRKAAVRQPRAASATPAALDSVFAEMRYPWTDMLDRLRLATQPGVELLTLEPDAGVTRRIRISGIANQPQSVLDLITALQKDPAWSSVQLVSQAKNDVNGPASTQLGAPPLPGLPELSGTGSPTLSFSLTAEWRRP
ncbi:PilN domain-containing protein [Burkholderia stagnalis]|uniref:PilN domain-containing protein n=1 Tax=Burkholderia stagnalis TaxID=1503054 RepID=UPI000AE1C20F|nr:PilN domain-containing protein [Burkholderia stagnalis]